MALVLIADDSRTVRVALRQALQQDGHETVEIQDLATLARALETERPDVIVLDLIMPGFNGTELARIIEAAAERPPPVVIHSGSDPELARIAARELRPFDIVPKGDSEVRLRHAVARALVSRHRPLPCARSPRGASEPSASE